MPDAKFSRRKVLRLAAFGSLGITAKLCLPSRVLAWSSVRSDINTHARIDTQAYNALVEESFFPKDLFPPLAEILDNEGSDAAFGSGNGPDRSGNSDFREHYYNPTISHLEEQGSEGDKPRAGGGPTSSSEWATWVYMAMTGEGDPKLTPKSAAWSAHYLADMFVPYHVVGIPVEILKKYLDENDELPKGMLDADKRVVGDLGLAYFTALGKYQKLDVSIQVKRFMAAYNKDRKTDWFDPWYWNGRGVVDWSIKDEYILSSHVLWEGKAHLESGDYKPVLHELWHNYKVPTFVEPWLKYKAQVEQFAKDCAKDTRKNLMPRYGDKASGVRRAVDGVYTIWRAAISALHGIVDVNESKDGYKISFSVTNTERNGEVKYVVAQLSLLKDGRMVKKKDAIVPVAELLKPGEEKKLMDVWNVEHSYLEEKALYQIKLEIAGKYKTPDAQYKVVKTTFGWPKIFKGKAFWMTSAPEHKSETSSDFLAIEPGSLFCSDPTPIIAILERPENGTGKLNFTFTTSWGIAFDGEMDPVCVKKKPQEILLKGKHDGKSNFNFSVGEKIIEGTFNEEKIGIASIVIGIFQIQGMPVKHEFSFTASRVQKEKNRESEQIQNQSNIESMMKGFNMPFEEKKRLLLNKNKRTRVLESNDNRDEKWEVIVE